ncbi:hypothetical protein V6N13_042730 [Hibiscus sabdariffa]
MATIKVGKPFQHPRGDHAQPAGIPRAAHPRRIELCVLRVTIRDLHQRSIFESIRRASWPPSTDRRHHRRPTRLPFHVATPPTISVRLPVSRSRE